MARQTFILLAALAGAVAAQDVVSIFLPQFDPQDLVASVVEVGQTATTYVIACPEGAADDACGLERANPPTIVNGPSTNEVHYSGDAITIDASCAIANDEAACTEIVVNAGDTASDEATITGVGASMLPVTVTAGADKLSAGPGASPTGDSSSTEGDKPTKTGDSEESGETGKDDEASDSPNAAIPKQTQNAMLAAVAAVVGGALML